MAVPAAAQERAPYKVTTPAASFPATPYPPEVIRDIASQHCASYGKITKPTGVQAPLWRLRLLRLHLEADPGARPTISGDVLIRSIFRKDHADEGPYRACFAVPPDARRHGAGADRRACRCARPDCGDMVMKMDSPPGMPAMTMQQCTDEATDKAMSTMFGGPQQSQCSEQKMQKSGSTITLDSVCTVAGVKATTRAVFTGDFQSAYTVKVNSKREGGAKSNMMMAAASGKTNMVIDAKWTGPCKAGQKAGDIIMPGGIKMNVTDMQQKMRQGGG